MSDGNDPGTGTDPAAPGAGGADEPSPGGGPRRNWWKVAATVAVLLALAAVGGLGAILLTAGGSDSTEGGEVLACVPTRDFTEEGKDDPDRVTCPPEDAPYVDGLLVDVEEDLLTLRTLEGDDEEINVREPDRVHLDVPHMRQHSSLRTPIRIYTAEHEGDTIAIYQVDTPADALEGL